MIVLDVPFTLVERMTIGLRTANQPGLVLQSFKPRPQWIVRPLTRWIADHIICRYGSRLNGIRPIAFLAKSFELLFGLSLVFRKSHPLADDFPALLVSRLHDDNYQTASPIVP